MHGSVLASFCSFITTRSGREQWQAIVRAAGVENQIYIPTRQYPDADALALFAAASQLAGTSSKQMMEDFGTHLAPSFLKLYGAMMPNWNTLDIAENSATVVHRVNRMRNPEAGPPKWKGTRVAEDEVQVSYWSRRGMCGLFVGAMRGFALALGDTVEVTEPQCMHRGDEACLIVLRRSVTPP